MLSKGLTIVAVLLIGIMGIFMVGCSSDNPISSATSASISGGELNNPSGGNGGTPEQRFQFEYTGRIAEIDRGNRSFTIEGKEELNILVDDNTKIYALPDFDEIDFDSKATDFEASPNQVKFEEGATISIYGGLKGENTIIAQFIEVAPYFNREAFETAF